MKDIVIAIDGYSGTGKSSTAKAVARRLHYIYVDSGAMYRTVTLHFLKNKVNLDDNLSVISHLSELELEYRFDNSKNDFELFLNDLHVGDQIRTPDVNSKVSAVAAIKEVRRALVKKQQALGEQKRIVMDGRDIGTIVFPQAELKIFMTAGIEVRAARRYRELLEKGINSDPDEISRNLRERDHFDSTRSDSPLVKAKDAIEIDTTHLTFDQQVNKIVKLAENIISEN